MPEAEFVTLLEQGVAAQGHRDGNRIAVAVPAITIHQIGAVDLG